MTNKGNGKTKFIWNDTEMVEWKKKQSQSKSYPYTFSFAQFTANPGLHKLDS